MKESVLRFHGPVLGIETSCDETSAAVLIDGRVASNVVSSQTDLHMKWGGIVPEAAARKHIENMLPVIEEALMRANLSLAEVAAVAVTNRPGLVGALSVGLTCAKGIAWANGWDLIGIHHLEAHALSPMMGGEIGPPYVCLLASGGHTELLYVRGVGEYSVLGRTLDDAAGEAFDKAARSLGLGSPGGPAIQAAAESGNAARYSLPRGLSDPTLDFSFSGLKTAVARTAASVESDADVNDLAASFQETICSVLAERTLLACDVVGSNAVSVAGGVAANISLRSKIKSGAEKKQLMLSIPPIELCTDNAAMIAFVGSIRLARGERSELDLDCVADSPLPGEVSYEPAFE